MSQQEEEMEPVDVRDMWKDEALDFTPWLARNLQYLGEEIGLDLKLIQTEKQVGSLSLDILARDANSGEKVAIENQLEWTDTHHLGQLITYATGCEARIAVWVATEFKYEYADALHKLNLWTSGDIKFFGVKVEAYRNNGNSCLKPRFTQVVYPGGRNDNLILPPNPPDKPRVQEYNSFFHPLVSALQESGFSNKSRQMFGPSGRIIPSHHDQRVGYTAYFRDQSDYLWVSVRIHSEDKDLSNSLFDKLHAQRELVENSIEVDPGGEWDWNRWDHSKYFTVAIMGRGSIDESWEDVAHIRKWMQTHLHRLKDFFEPRLDRIVNGLPL